MIAVPATAQSPKPILTASSPVLVEEVVGDGVRGVPEGSALLGMKGMLDGRSCWVDSEKSSAKTSSRVYILAPEPTLTEPTLTD